MRRLLLVVLMLGIAGSAMAANLGTQAEIKPLLPPYNPPADPRQAGDNISSAYVIPSLPFADTGTTVGYLHDYASSCASNSAPDVVYVYTATASGNMSVTLCGSDYDSCIHVHAGAIGNEIGCNDDYCGLQSQLNGLAITSGTTYIIIVAGFSTASGNYAISVTMDTPPQPFECPAGALHENEPACMDNYQDHWNGGCNSTPVVWLALEGQAGGCADMCGYACTYVNGGVSTRDTDWYLSTGTGVNVVVTGTAEFGYMMAIMYGTNCAGLQYTYVIGNANTPSTLSWAIANGAPVGTFMAPSGFVGVPNSQYRFNICGIVNGGPNPTETTSWGSLKNQYK